MKGDGYNSESEVDEEDLHCNKSFHQLTLSIIKLPRTEANITLLASISPSYCESPTLLKNGKLSAFWVNRLIKSNYYSEAFHVIQTAFAITEEKESLIPCIEELASHYRGKNDQRYQNLIKLLSSLTTTQ
ncbi:hypothetical protein GZ78_29155 [Endozoicomonas numazuensis]|uniref:Uncharacterized protein n=1 Tax=Endozoicomonas numazuensis TaxID=1137799 RepID=A0A081MYS3_9GAMM|nr:hypothetical protein GZ78_29155 [Endozoicomonas numazuensis]